MQAVILTLLVVAGADPVAMTTASPAAVSASGHCTQCDGHGADCYSSYHSNGVRDCLFDCLGPMPQTCYAPRYGCYPGNNRFMHRYPAFHGYYYRQPYNYRHLFDYPWHAAPHQPVDYFTYENQVIEGEAVPESQQGSPTPAPSAGRASTPGWQARAMRRSAR